MNKLIRKTIISILTESNELGSISSLERPYYIAHKKVQLLLSNQGKEAVINLKNNNPQYFRKAVLYGRYLKIMGPSGSNTLKFENFLKNQYRNQVISSKVPIEEFPKFDQPYVEAYREYLEAKRNLNQPQWIKDNPEKNQMVKTIEEYILYNQKNIGNEWTLKDYIRNTAPLRVKPEPETETPKQTLRTDDLNAIMSLTDDPNELESLLRGLNALNVKYVNPKYMKPAEDSSRNKAKEYLDTLRSYRKYGKTPPTLIEFLYSKAVEEYKERGEIPPTFTSFKKSIEKNLRRE